MGGGLMQLVAYGAQDIYLTGNPQITFFKVVYRRHTNFSMESIEQTFNGTPARCARVSCTISRNGDLVHKMHLRFQNSAEGECVCDASGVRVGCNVPCSPIPLVDDSTNADGTSRNANDLIKSVEVEIGGQRIDKHYGDWLNIWAQLNTPVSKNDGLSSMLHLDMGTFSYVPLRFWFNRNPGLALPLIALQYHEVKLNVEFTKAAEELSGCGGTCEKTPAAIDNRMSKTKLFVDYIYLDTDERRRFAQVSHEYLIEQLQFTGSKALESAGTVSERLNFNHPVKELIWRATGAVTKANADNFSLDVSGRITDLDQTTSVCATGQWNDITLQLNGHERFTPRHSEYFRLVQPYEHHTQVPVTSGIHVYSFALKPEEHQPSGTCNFSRIDNAVLKCNGANTWDTTGADESSAIVNPILNIYAVNYNVLRIMSGMGGLAYSN
jgi:hypothetical protein